VALLCCSYNDALRRRIIKWISKNLAGRARIGFGWGQGQEAGCCEHGHEPSGSIKFGNFSTSF
jgi:hypothetical protein